MTDLIFKEECYTIIGICMEVHNILGPGLLEDVYKEAMEIEFSLHNIPYQREKPFIIAYKSTFLNKRYKADFVAFDQIILEIKADKAPLDNHFRQTLNYFALAKSPIGLIINFGDTKLAYKRIIKSEFL